MGILDEDVVRVRDATDLVALASEHLAVKRVGRNFVGLCPFHSEKTPSFNVNPETGRFRCFGCDASGDAITFVRDVEHLDFVDAVERLAVACRHHAALRRQERRQGPHAQAALVGGGGGGDRLLPRPPARRRRRQHARGYLRSRGFDGDAARQFQLGWSPDDWDRLSLHLQRRSSRATTSRVPASRS